jgi:hypothetical protein
LLFFLRRYRKNANNTTRRIPAATPTPIPAAAPVDSPEDVLMLGAEVPLVEEVGEDIDGVVDAGTEGVVEEEEEEEEVVVATTLKPLTYMP